MPPRAKKVLKADVHIAPCLDCRCKNSLQKLVTELKICNLTCVSEYPLRGKYLTWFEEAFNNCYFTILHRCPVLWEKMARCQQLFADEMKIMTVEIHRPALEMDYVDEGDADIVRFVNFFREFMTVDLTSNENRREFAQRVEKEVGEIVNEENQDGVEESHPCDIAVSVEQSESEAYSESCSLQSPLTGCQTLAPLRSGDRPMNEVTVDAEGAQDGLFEVHPGLFGHHCSRLSGHKNLFVRKSCLVVSEVARLPTPNMEGLQLRETLNGIKTMSSRHAMELSKWIVLEIIPEMFNSRNIFGLASIATCDTEVLSERALVLLEIVLMENSCEEDNSFGFDDLANVASVLHTSLKDLKLNFKKTPLNKQQSHVWRVRELTNVQLMIMCEVVSFNQKPGYSVKCDNFFDTMVGQLLASEADSLTEHLKNVDDFVKYVQKHKCAKVMDKRNSFFDEMTFLSKGGFDLSGMKKIMKWPVPVQFCVLFEALKRIYFLVEPSCEIMFLKLYTTDCIHKPESACCGFLLKKCFIHLLLYGSWRTLSRDITNLCRQFLTILDQLNVRFPFDDIDLSIYYKLLCDNNFLFQNYALRKRKSIPVNVMFDKVLGEIQDNIQPLLVIDTVSSVACSRLAGQWSIRSGKFNADLSVLVHVRELAAQPLQHPSEWTAVTHQDFLLNQLKQLKHLQHPHIIQMFVYQDTGLPQFYVCEDYSRQNLQVLLKNRGYNKDFVPRRDLLRYLTDCVSAVAFCHSRSVVHCNLTAASLCLTETEVLKLCGFHLAHETVNEMYICYNNSGVPTRWSAPESLQYGCHSFASDCWMLGHLVFEVLTHGMLPYSEHTDVESLVDLLCRNQVHLIKQRCFEPESWKLIQDCTVFDPGSRPSVALIEQQLQEIYDMKQSHDSERYPRLTNLCYQSSTDHEIGVKTPLKTSSVKKEIRNVTDRITRCTIGDKYVFTEKLLHKWPSEMIVCLNSEKGRQLLPGVTFYEHVQENPHVEISIPASCLGPLSSVTRDRRLGSDLGHYVHCLSKVVAKLDSLHRNHWVLGDLCADNIYVEDFRGDSDNDGDIEVYFTSLCHLSHSDSYTPGHTPVQLHAPEDAEVCARSAPEVTFQGMYSPASDVFCFGKLAEDVLARFDKASLTTAESNFDVISSLQNDRLTSVISQCCCGTDSNRPTAEAIQNQLCEILVNMNYDFNISIFGQTVV